MSELVAAIDVGTTGTHTIIFNTAGKMAASAYKEYPSIMPQIGYVEQDANQWWLAVVETLRSVCKDPAVEKQDIIAITVTNQRETIVPVDRAGQPLHNAIVWQDRRTVKQCQAINRAVGQEDIYKTTGLIIDPYFSASKLMWLKDNKPKIFDSTHKFLLVHDFIVNKLTGEFVTDHSNASRTMLFDINDLCWSDLLCDELGIPQYKLPRSVPSATVIGTLTSKAAAHIGVNRDIPVIAGGGDQQCAALGLGVVSEGLVSANTGTGTFILAHMKKPRLDQKMRVLCSLSVIPGETVLEASIFTTGAVYRWFRDNFAHFEKEHARMMGFDVYELLNKEVESAQPGAHGLFMVPHFAGAGAPHWQPQAKGMLYGLTLAHSRPDVLRAIIEGICFEVKTSLDVFSDLGIDISELRIAGGATRAEIWNQLQADIYGLPVAKTEHEETTALGAAILGCLGCKVFRTYDEAVDRMVELRTKYDPRTKLKRFYKDQYLKYKKLYECVASNLHS